MLEDNDVKVAELYVKAMFAASLRAVNSLDLSSGDSTSGNVADGLDCGAGLCWDSAGTCCCLRCCQIPLDSDWYAAQTLQILPPSPGLKPSLPS
eukprot:5651813-Amphidinium_carterae.1